MTGSVIALSVVVSFVYIFLKAMQQLNVMHGNYWLVTPMSIGINICEATILLLIVRADSIWLGAINGCGAGLGAMLAMTVHKLFVRREVG